MVNNICIVVMLLCLIIVSAIDSIRTNQNLRKIIHIEQTKLDMLLYKLEQENNREKYDVKI